MNKMELTIAIAGNPNCGKTALFNALTGANQAVGNWPGVSVEKKEGYTNVLELLIVGLRHNISWGPRT